MAVLGGKGLLEVDVLWSAWRTCIVWYEGRCGVVVEQAAGGISPGAVLGKLDPLLVQGREEVAVTTACADSGRNRVCRVELLESGWRSRVVGSWCIGERATFSGSALQCNAVGCTRSGTLKAKQRAGSETFGRGGSGE